MSNISNISFYEALDDEKKWIIITLIRAGFDKRSVIKLYIYMNPSDINEAIDYLTPENGLYKHFFFPSKKNPDACDICGEMNNSHNKQNIIKNNLISSNDSINNIDTINIEPHIITIRNKVSENYSCKICDENIKEKESKRNKCLQCDNYFCDECLYLHIKELIKNGKYEIGCPECNDKYSEKKIDQILSFNKKNKKEIRDLKNLLNKNNLKNFVLSNPNLMFCPIVNCGGFAEKNNKNFKFNICNKGHKFCKRCGELWHKNGKCPEEKEVDYLFKEYSKGLNIKYCPFCHIATIKIAGCNHITCTYCKKEWCWICQKLFRRTEEHYSNKRSKCYNRMFDIENIFCFQCNNGTNSFITFNNCGHSCCKNCFKNYILANFIKIKKETNIKCFQQNCNQISIFKKDFLINFIEESRDINLYEKYEKSIKLYSFIEYEDYNIFRYFSYDSFIEFLELFERILKNCIDNEIIGITFFFILIFIFCIIFPIFININMRKYYYKFSMDVIKKYNKALVFPIIIAEEILCLIYLIPFIVVDHFYSLLMFILFLFKEIIFR